MRGWRCRGIGCCCCPRTGPRVCSCSSCNKRGPGRWGEAMAMPEWLEPMAATLTEERFAGPDWLFERKYDGIRLLAYKRGKSVTLYSRNRLEQHCPRVAEVVAGLPVRDA